MSVFSSSPSANRRAVSAPSERDGDLTRSLQQAASGDGGFMSVEAAARMTTFASFSRDNSTYYGYDGALDPSDVSVRSGASLRDGRTSFVAPTSRGKNLPLLQPSLALRTTRPMSRAWTISVTIGSLLVIGGLVLVCALVATKNHTSNAGNGVPAGLLGIGGFTVRTEDQTAFNAVTRFWNKTLRTYGVHMCPDAQAYSAVELPNHDIVTMLEPELGPSSNTHAFCPVIHFRVRQLQPWVDYFRHIKVPLLGETIQCRGVDWQYFHSPDGSVLAVEALSQPANGTGLTQPAKQPPPPPPAVAAATATARRGRGRRRRTETRDSVLGVSYAGAMYTELSQWVNMLTFWQQVMGFTCTGDCTSTPSDGAFASFALPDGDRVEMYYNDPQHAFMNQCIAPGLEVGDYDTLRAWFEYLSIQAATVTTAVSPLTQYQETQGWFWIAAPTGVAWNGTSTTHNVIEVVASASTVQANTP